MAADFSIRGDTRLDASGFSSGLSKLGGIAVKGFAAIGSASVAAISAIATAGVTYNASMEQYQTAFTTMLGSADAADTLTDSLKKLAAQTPLAMTDLADASKTLLAFGTTADALPGTLKQLGDIALGDAEKLGTMATAFGRIQSNGRASMEEINMMIDQGFNPLNIIAEKTGETMEQVRDRVSAGAVSFEEISDAINVATSEGGQFYNAMEAQSKTLTGQLSTLKDNAMAVAGALSEGLSEGIATTVLPMMNSWMDELLTATQERGIEGAIEVGGSIIAEAITAILEYLPQMLSTATSLVSSFLTGIQESIPMLIEAIIQIGLSLVTAFFELIPQLILVGAQILGGLIQGIIEALPQIATAAFTIVNQLYTSIIEGLPTLLQGGVSLVQSLVQGITNNLPDILNKGVELNSKLIDGLLQNLPGIIDSGTQIIEALVQGFVDTVPQLISQIPVLIGNIITSITNNLPQIIKSGMDLITSLISGIGQMAGSLISEFPKLISQIFEVFKNVDWLQLGVDIIKGIINGIGSMASALWDAIVNIAKSAFDGIKNFFGINSPSTLMRDKIGKMLPSGAAIGVEANTDEFVKSLEDMASLGLDAVENSNHFAGQTAQYNASAVQPAVLNANWRGESETIIVMDGREVAKVVTPYVNERLAW